MEAVAQMRAAIPGIAPPLQRLDPGLSGNRGGVEDGMVEAVPVEDQFLRNGCCGVEANEKRAGRIDALEPVHPVMDGDVGVVGRAIRTVHPARPAAPPSRHHTGVTMQYGDILLVAEG